MKSCAIDLKKNNLYFKYFQSFFLLLFTFIFYATFQCRPYNIFKKILNWFFAHKNLKKQASKVAHNRPIPLFTVQPNPQPTADSPELTFHNINYFVRRLICVLICCYSIPSCNFSFLIYGWPAADARGASKLVNEGKSSLQVSRM